MPQPITRILDLIANASPTIAVLGAGSGWRLGVGRLLDIPDTQIVLYDSVGQLPNPKWLLDYPWVQVMVRGEENGYNNAAQKAQDVADLLLGHPPVSYIEGDRIDGITIVGTPSFIGNDQKNRPCISGNFRLIYEPVASTYSNRQPL